MIVGTDTLYGNEWIRYDQSYYKISVGADGIYRLSYQSLSDAGVPVSSIAAEHFQLFYLGQEIPVFTTTNNIFGSDDFIEFHGVRNRSELDRFLFIEPDKMLNPFYSLFNDTSAYFLTWNLNETGKRYQSVSNDISNPPPPQQWFWFESILYFTSLHEKLKNVSDINQSQFGEAEGFTKEYPPGTTVIQTFAVPADHLYESGPANAEVTMRYVCKNGSHHQVVSVNNTPYVDEQFDNYAGKKYEFDVPVNVLTTAPVVKIEGLASVDSYKDKQSVANIKVRYPRSFDFDNQPYFKFEIAAAAGITYLEIANFNATGGTPVIYDLTNDLRLVAIVDNDLVKIALPPAATTRQLVLFNNNTIPQVLPLSEVTFIDYFQEEGNYIILSDARFFDDGQTPATNWVQKYAAFRASPSGGGFDTVIIEVGQLYNQFAYGINRHNICLRNFTHFVKKNWESPEYLLFLGKGLEYKRIRYASDFALQDGSSFFVPTFGFPGSDNIAAADNYSNTPLLSVGRLPVSKPEDIRIYLEKVQEYTYAQSSAQTIEDKAWMKQAIHLSGGDIAVQELVKLYLAQMANELKTNLFGADFHTFYKTSTDPIQTSNYDEIENLINNGVSLITFMGHSSPNAIDFNINEPTSYQNNNKYFFMFSLGCFTGLIHDTYKTLGERFVLIPDKGAIGFLATSGYGSINALEGFGEKFYSHIGGSQYQKGIGDALRATISDYDDPAYSGYRELIQQMTLLCDPAIGLNPHPGPDYVIDKSTIRFNPSSISIEEDSFSISLDIVNIGRNDKDTIVLEINQTFPDASTATVIFDTIIPNLFRHSLTYRLPVSGEQALGLNRFNIKIDATDHVAELPMPEAEQNNELVNEQGVPGIEVYFYANDVRQVYPVDQGIVSSGPVRLIGSTSNMFAPSQKYLLELDTTELFIAPLATTSIIQQGGVIEWKPQITFQDSTVYYWRVSPDSTNAFGYVWRQSSFIYLPGSSDGWNQSHFYQYKKDHFENIELPDSTQAFSFIDNAKGIKIRNYYYPYPNISAPGLLINNAQAQYYLPSGTVTSGVYVTVLDTILVVPMENPSPGLYGSYNTIPDRVIKAFPFRTDSLAEREKLIRFLRDSVPSGYYVAFWTIQRATGNGTSYYPELWALDSIGSTGSNIFQVLEAQGATRIRETATSGSLPYGFFYRKDHPEYPGYDFLADSVSQYLEHDYEVLGNWDEGSVESIKIGPASKWHSLHWKTGFYDPATDMRSLEVTGINTQNNATLLLTGVMAADTTLEFIDAGQYPYLQLRWHSGDTTYRTSAQLDYWRVLYEGLPEAAINPVVHYDLYNDTLQQGEKFKLEMAVMNISHYDMDSLLVKYRFTDEANQDTVIYVRIGPLLTFDTMITQMELDTRFLSGIQRLQAEINPDDDQPELYHFNNIAFDDFYIQKDNLNPLLDVTFDGTHIMNGDIIAPRPQIVVTLKDENIYLALEDTSLFRIYILYPDETSPRRIYFNTGEMTFFPAVTGNLDKHNRATIELNPVFTIDGTYQLIVNATDATGNDSGDRDYAVAFEVITRQAISNVLNYPNPFSTATRFVYTITGEEPPAYFKIQIMTISGQIIREITQAEMGAMRIGKQISDFVWDGTDQYGDRLANGVYLYRVIAKKADGTDYEKIDTGTDQYFSKGFGKLVIMR